MDGLLGAGGGGKEYDVAPHPPKLLGVLLPPSSYAFVEEQFPAHSLIMLLHLGLA